MTSTICAIATPSGGALGIIRISGPDAISATSQIFTPSDGKSLAQHAANTIVYGTIADEKGKIVDEVLVSLFRSPHSYTGEDCTEMSCHGSSFIMQRIVQLLIHCGCRMAKPGEYTKRAFMNGKMDLSRAEAVADLIASTCESNHQIAMRQMRGEFSKELSRLNERLLHLTTLLELELDFSDHEDLEFADRAELRSLAESIKNHIRNLCQSFRVGNALKKGIPTAIVGETNAGKSTLLNALLGEERALVSNIHGTTRDTIEELINIGSNTIRLIDTAGLRSTNDTIELMGIERSYAKISEAEIILWVIDSSAPLPSFDDSPITKIINEKDGKQLIIVLNKSDLIPSENIPIIKQKFGLSLQQALNRTDLTILPLCAKNFEAINTIHTAISNAAERFKSLIPQSTTLVSNLRHYEALSKALIAFNRVIEGLQTNLSGDLISQDLRECIYHLNDIAGQVTSEDVLANIFKNFCVGK